MGLLQKHDLVHLWNGISFRKQPFVSTLEMPDYMGYKRELFSKFKKMLLEKQVLQKNYFLLVIGLRNILYQLGANIMMIELIS